MFILDNRKARGASLIKEKKASYVYQPKTFIIYQYFIQKERQTPKVDKINHSHENFQTV